MDLMRQAWRGAFARRAHAALVIAAIAAGVAANAVVFGVVDAAILRPFPFPEPDRVIGVGAAYPRLNRPLEFFESMSGPEFAAVRDHVRSFERVTAFDLSNETIMLGATPERVFAGLFWEDPFAVLGVAPAAGRSFSVEELRTAAPVAILSDTLARRLSATPDALVGSAARIAGRPHTIIGIMPKRVHLYDTDLWLPMPGAPETLPQTRRQFNVLGRLAPGVSMQTLDTDLARVAKGIEGEHRAALAEYEGFTFQGRAWPEIDVWGFGNVARITFAAVGLLLVLIVVNLANLLLSRAEERRREMAIRAALGADRSRLAGQVTIEALVLCAAGGAAGLALAAAGLRVVSASLGVFLPTGAALVFNWRLVAFALAITVGAAVLVSLAPVVRLLRGQLLAPIGTGRATSGRGTRRVQRALVAVQVAVALIVTGSALLLATAVARVLGVDPGFPHTDAMAMRMTLPLPKYDGRSMALFDALMDGVRALPSVAEATVSNQPPPGVFSRAQFAIQGQPPTDRLPSAFFTTAGPRYGATLGLELVRGRWFDDRAGRDGVRELVINEAAARRFFPDTEAIGQRLLVAPPHSDRRPAEIVGIVRDVRNRGLVREAEPEITASVRQIPDRRQSQLYLVVRGRAGSARLLDDVRGVLARLDPEQPVYAVSTIRELYVDSLASRRAASALLVFFASVALGLAMLGIYGVVSRAVVAREREIGIRSALGAGPPIVRREVIADALKPIAVGVVGGLVVLLAAQKTLASWLYGVQPEVAILVTASGLLLAIGWAATLRPAWRASRIDPVNVLR